MPTRFDHIVIAASTLEEGVAYVRDTLGVTLPKGGEHPLMGTHNHLMKIGDERFLELVAINPDAKAPSRPRWFALDDPAVQHSLQAKPRLLTWVVNTDNLANLQTQSSLPLGEPVALTRGDLRWLFAIPKDGSLLAGGLLPHVMQWQTDTHPSNGMQDLNCRLVELTVHHPYADWVSAKLEQMGAADIATIKPRAANELPYLSVCIDTPNGQVELDSRPAS